MSDQSEPLDPEEQEKPLQDPDDPDLERGEYVESPEGQEAIWAGADAVPQCAEETCEEPAIVGEDFCPEHRFDG